MPSVIPSSYAEAVREVMNDVDALARRECPLCPPERVVRCAHFGEASVRMHTWQNRQTLYVCYNRTASPMDDDGEHTLGTRLIEYSVREEADAYFDELVEEMLNDDAI